MKTRYFLQRGPVDVILALTEDGKVVAAEEISIEIADELLPPEADPLPRSGKKKKEDIEPEPAVDKPMRLCSMCKKSGHIKRHCPLLSSAPLAISDDFMPVASERDIERIWRWVDNGVVEYKNIAQRTGFSVRMVENVLLKPRP